MEMPHTEQMASYSSFSLSLPLITSPSFHFFFTPVSHTTLKATPTMEKNALPPKYLPFLLCNPHFTVLKSTESERWLLSSSPLLPQEPGILVEAQHASTELAGEEIRKISQVWRNWNDLEVHRTAQKRYRAFNRALINWIWKSKPWDPICPLGIASHTEGRGCSVVTHSQGLLLSEVDKHTS